MKHWFAKIAGAAGAALLCIAFAACTPSAGMGNARAELLESDGTCLVIRVTEGDMDKNLYDVLCIFEQNGEITFDGTQSEYGFYLTSLNGVEADAENYWALYTTLGTLDGVSYSDASYGTWEYDGRTLASASYGVSGLPLVEGELYALIRTSVA